MASDIENVAKALRALAADSGRAAGQVNAATREVAGLVDSAYAQGRSGLNVARLVGQLQSAADRSRRAAAAVKQIDENGSAFADHLAATRHERQSHPIRDSVFGVGVGLIVGGADGPVPSSPSTDVPCDTVAAAVDRSADAIDRASHLHDQWEASNQLAKRGSDDITADRS